MSFPPRPAPPRPSYSLLASLILITITAPLLRPEQGPRNTAGARLVLVLVLVVVLVPVPPPLPEEVQGATAR